MSVSLADALQQVSLEVGRIYRCQIGNLRVEVRVEESEPVVLPTTLNASDVMLDPWIDLPSPQTATVLEASAGPALLPDLPLLPEVRECL